MIKQYLEINFFKISKASNPTEDGNKNYVDFEFTKQNVIIDNEFVKKSGSLMTGDLILQHYNYPVQGNTNKVISYETERNIFKSQRVFSFANMNNNLNKNLKTATRSNEAVNKLLSDQGLALKINKIIKENIDMNNKQITNLGYDISNPSDVVNLSFCDQKYYQKTGDSDLNLNEQRVKNSLAPIDKRDLANKAYVDSKIVDTTQFIKKSGDQMTGNLDLDSNFVTNVGIDINDDTAAVPKSYIDAFISGIVNNPATSDLKMNNFKIKQLKSPTDDNDGANKGFVDKSIADELNKLHITLPTNRENVLKYMLDTDELSSEANIIVLGIVDIPDSVSIHKYNKKGYSITIQKNLGSNNYRI